MHTGVHVDLDITNRPQGIKGEATFLYTLTYVLLHLEPFPMIIIMAIFPKPQVFIDVPVKSLLQCQLYLKDRVRLRKGLIWNYPLAITLFGILKSFEILTLSK